MTQATDLDREIAAIKERELALLGDYEEALRVKPADSLRVAFVMPYGHQYSLLCMGPLSLYDLVNRSPDVPATAERAIVYECMAREGKKYSLPEGTEYVTIESGTPVAQFDVVGLTITNAADLPSLFSLLDTAGIPRRASSRADDAPILIGGNSGFSNPEVFADFVDVVALGDAEASLLAALDVISAGRREGITRPELMTRLSGIPGLYVPAAYLPADSGARGTAVPSSDRTPALVAPQYISADDLNPAHFVSPISDGTTAMIVPTLGCRWACHFCVLGVPAFRQAPLDTVMAYLDQLEANGVTQIVISSPTFTQYRHRFKVLDRIRQYAERSERPVTTIIGSVRADELSERYLKAVGEVGEFGHLFTELKLENQRGIVTIAPEFASPDLVRIFNKTMDRTRVERSIEICRESDAFANMMMYFIVGVPGETDEDRLAIADYVVDTFYGLADPDATVILKLQQFMPSPNTVSQRLPMAHPDNCDGWTEQIENRIRALVGPEAYRRNFRVVGGDPSRLLLEAVCMRGGRVVGRLLEELHDQGVDFGAITSEALEGCLSRHKLELSSFLRQFEIDEPLPWGIVNHVNPLEEVELAHALARRADADQLDENASEPAPRKSLPIIGTHVN